MTAVINYPVTFNGVSISSIAGIQVYSVNPYGVHRQVNINQLARRAARKVSSAFYDTREIYISVYINAVGRDAADKVMDNLLAAIQNIESPLLFMQSGALRQYTATYSDYAINNEATGNAPASPQGGFIDLTLTFECSDSYGYDPMYTSIQLQRGITSQSFPINYTQGGGASEQAPFLEVQLTALTGGTNATITIGNQNNGQAVSITRTWSQYDIIQIDSRNETVQVNGVDVIFTGGIPKFGLGPQTIYYVDNLTTRTVTVNFYVYQRWN